MLQRIPRAAPQRPSAGENSDAACAGSASLDQVRACMLEEGEVNRFREVNSFLAALPDRGTQSDRP